MSIRLNSEYFLPLTDEGDQNFETIQPPLDYVDIEGLENYQLPQATGELFKRKLALKNLRLPIEIQNHEDSQS